MHEGNHRGWGNHIGGNEKGGGAPTPNYVDYLTFQKTNVAENEHFCEIIRKEFSAEKHSATNYAQKLQFAPLKVTFMTEK